MLISELIIIMYSQQSGKKRCRAPRVCFCSKRKYEKRPGTKKWETGCPYESKHRIYTHSFLKREESCRIFLKTVLFPTFFSASGFLFPELQNVFLQPRDFRERRCSYGSSMLFSRSHSTSDKNGSLTVRISAGI